MDINDSLFSSKGKGGVRLGKIHCTAAAAAAALPR